MLAGAKVIVVDDDPGIRDLVADFLGRHGYEVITAASAQDLDGLLEQQAIDLIILDVMMPGEDGLSVCRRLAASASAPPIIMLSAIGDDTDRIIGLEIGADDYLSKPCNPRELLARVRAVLRRSGERSAPADDGAKGQQLQFSGWLLHLARRELRNPAGVVVNLSDGEFTLLQALAERPQRVLSRDQLIEFARGYNSDSFDRAIDVQVSRLRRKLGSEQTEELIRTVRNQGYMFVPSVQRR